MRSNCDKASIPSGDELYILPNMSSEEHVHPILGEIRSSESNRGGVEALISFDDRIIPIRIDPDDRTMEQAIDFASLIIIGLPCLEAEMRSIAVRDLCPKYNDGWNEFDEVQDDGTIKTVINPQLTDEEFASNLTLDGISITGNEGVEFWYDDSDMFWGHSVFVSSLEGMDFSNAQAELFG